MIVKPFISICIPSYKNRAYLKVLLDTINEQTFKDFEVIVSDDSPDDDITKLCSEYKNLNFQYVKNNPPLGSPANWNNAIKLSKGEWIKLMHDDDWFSSSDSLHKFANAAIDHPDRTFQFSAHNSYENGRFLRTARLTRVFYKILKSRPLILFHKNFIGHPSTTLIKNLSENYWYDENVKWVVDFEFYIRCLKTQKSFYINDALVNVGINDLQITKKSFRNPAIEIPENLYLLNKLGTKVLKDPVVYDYYWRLFRNLKISDWETIRKYANGVAIPDALKRMFDFQQRFNQSTLKRGFLSKPIMVWSYLRHRFNGNT